MIRVSSGIRRDAYDGCRKQYDNLRSKRVWELTDAGKFQGPDVILLDARGTEPRSTLHYLAISCRSSPPVLFDLKLKSWAAFRCGQYPWT